MADFHRSALAVWSGSLKTGEGRASVESGLLRDAPVTFVSRFEQGRGTNPEELVAAAHASCFSMALSAVLSQAGSPPDEIRTRATVRFQRLRNALMSSRESKRRLLRALSLT